MNLVKIPSISKDDIESRDKLIENLQTKNQILAIWIEGTSVWRQWVNMSTVEMLGAFELVKHSILHDEDD